MTNLPTRRDMAILREAGWTSNLAHTRRGGEFEPMRHLVSRLILAAALAACLDPIRPKPPLNVTINAAPLTVTIGQEVNFTVNAQGNDLLQVIALFGDGAEETVQTGGATTARVNFAHAYSTAGTFNVTGRAIDGVEGQRDATIQITVQ